MIPKFDIEISQDLDLSEIKLPEEGLMKHDTGLMCNHDYADKRGRSWDQAKEALELEKEIVSRADAKSETEDEFEDAVAEITEETADNYVTLDEFDVGVAAASIAFSAAGCVPVSSCRGHQFNDERHPYIGGWADKERAKALIEICKECNVGISNYVWERDPGILIYSASIKDMMLFAEKLIENARRFQQKEAKPDLVQHSLKEYKS